MSEPIEVPEGTEGQNTKWPGEKPTPKSGTEITEDNGDKTTIPIVR